MKIFLKPAADLYYDAILKLNAHVLMIEALKAGSVGGIFFILRSLTLAKKRRPIFFRTENPTVSVRDFNSSLAKRNRAIHKYF